MMLVEKRRELFNAHLIAGFLHEMVGIEVTPATIRQWARRGHIQRRGTGHNGIALYDLPEILRHAQHVKRRRSLRAA